MARVIAALMRHGVYEQPAGTPSAHLLYGLTGKGETQSRATAAAIVEICEREGWDFDPVIDCSTLLRAWQTAVATADELCKLLRKDFRCEQFEALMERSVGAAANLDMDQISELVELDPRLDPLPGNWKSLPDYTLPIHGAESLMEAGARVREHVVARCAELESHDRDTLKLFVGHGGSHRHAAVQLGALPLEEARKYSLRHGGFVLLARGDDGRWEKIGGDWKLRTAGDISMQSPS